MPTPMNLTAKEIEWFRSRVSKSSNGEIAIPSQLYRKYRELTEDKESPAKCIKELIIQQCFPTNNEESIMSEQTENTATKTTTIAVPTKVKACTRIITEEELTFIFNTEPTECVTIAFSHLPQKIYHDLMVYGLSQKIGASFSGEKDPAIQVVLAHACAGRLCSGIWNPTRKTAPVKYSQLVRACAKVQGLELEAIKAKLDASDKSIIASIRKHPLIAKALIEDQLKDKEEKLAKKMQEKPTGEEVQLNLVFSDQELKAEE